MARGWRVTAYTRTGNPPPGDPGTTGFATGTTDEQGGFSFPAIASGGLQLDLRPPRDLPVLADQPRSLSVVEGRANAIEVPLRKAATVTGIIVERGTGKPVPGVELYLIQLHGAGTLKGRTDEQGR